ncbi:PREDICTED: stromelysin-2-like [Wasmannia auropunctata]|uniref:stromelysin-2-like n=1 Tax=Wasmannia auropunctata TaxID=64793 RepID=UPI0005EFB220|nr:PREDICTED: stromelysin-2-like [Wasmannia auropunctata]
MRTREYSTSNVQHGVNPDILISFRNGVHTFANRRNGDVCPYALDGPDDVLAHAFPLSDRDGQIAEIHVDKTEPWYIQLNMNPPEKIHLLLILTHEIGQALGLHHSPRNDSIMFAYATSKYPGELNIEDILAIQYLYGVKYNSPKTESVPMTTTEMTPTTTTTTTKPEYVDLCDLKYVDNILVLDHRIFVTYQRYVRTDRIYIVDYPSFTLSAGWPRTLKDIGLPTTAIIIAAINTNKGRTYVIFNGQTIAEINECTMTVIKYHTLQMVFPVIPSDMTLAYRYIDGSCNPMDGVFVNLMKYAREVQFSVIL